jgi:lipoprotein NlpD
MQRSPLLIWMCSAAALALSGCAGLDIDLRNGQSGFTTAEAARTAAAARPTPDARGVIAYPDYQVVVARPDDTVATVANRIGVNPTELARYNALTPETSLRAGEILALPRNVAIASGPLGSSGGIEISTLADTAIARAEGGQPVGSSAITTQPAGTQPTRHVVQRGETAFTIARLYNVSARALADWNGLDPEMRVREGQTLLIPVVQPAFSQSSDARAAPPAEPVTQPGSGSPTPVPPIAATPMPAPAQPAAQAQAAAEAARPASPNLSQERTATAAPTSLAMPVDGRVIRAYAPGKSEWIGFAAPAGASVKAAADGKVRAIIKSSGNVTIVVDRTWQ